MNDFASPSALLEPSQWPVSVESGALWSLGNPIGWGESQPRHVTRICGLAGVAKPATQAGSGVPRAAHEKISSDLAHLIGVSVPPVILWTDPLTGGRYSISCWAYKQAMTWRQMASSLSAKFLENVAQRLADAIVFHTWIGDTDRHDQNTLVNAASTETAPEVCFIDHAFSMTYSPSFVNGQFTPAVHRYLPRGLVSVPMLAPAAKRVQDMAPDRVEAVVRRIPAAFLPENRADTIVARLLQQQGEICRLLGV